MRIMCSSLMANVHSIFINMIVRETFRVGDVGRVILCKDNMRFTVMNKICYIYFEVFIGKLNARIKDLKLNSNFYIIFCLRYTLLR